MPYFYIWGNVLFHFLFSVLLHKRSQTGGLLCLTIAIQLEQQKPLYESLASHILRCLILAESQKQ